MKNTIIKALESCELNYDIIREEDDQIVFKFGILIDNAHCQTYIDVRTERSLVLIYTVCPTAVPQNQKNRVAEFLVRANQGLYIGNFELDFNDGEIRYKASYTFDETFPHSEEVFRKNLYATFNNMERYLPGIMTVIYSNISPEQAVNQIENEANPSLN